MRYSSFLGPYLFLFVRVLYQVVSFDKNVWLPFSYPRFSIGNTLCPNGVAGNKRQGALDTIPEAQGALSSF